MAEFKRERVLFHIIGQGEVEVEYEVGAETAEERLRFIATSNWLSEQVRGGEFEWVMTCSTEPDPLDIERAAGRQLEMEQADNARAREDEADQWRMNR